MQEDFVYLCSFFCTEWNYKKHNKNIQRNKLLHLRETISIGFAEAGALSAWLINTADQIQLKLISGD